MKMEPITVAAELFTREGSRFAGTPTTDDRGRLGYFPGWRSCARCGGQGWAQKWQFTGLKCFDCGGAGKLPSDRFIRLFTAAELERLNAAQTKRDATRARKAAEAAAIEAQRREAERAGVVAANAELLALIRPYVERSPFLAEMVERIEVDARPLSEKQEAAARKSAAAMLAEDDRRARATHVGEVGQRIELELEYVRSIDLTESYFGARPFVIWVFRTAEGCSVVYKGGTPAAFDGLPRETIGEGRDRYSRIVKGGKIRVVASVKEHGQNRKTGEPETIIARPKSAD